MSGHRADRSLKVREYVGRVADKSPQMNDFLQHVKATPELNSMFESIQKDALTTTSEIVNMDTSWTHRC